jgi:hypothetical protein
MTVVRTFSTFILHQHGEFSTGNGASGSDGTDHAEAKCRMDDAAIIGIEQALPTLILMLGVGPLAFCVLYIFGCDLVKRSGNSLLFFLTPVFATT